MSPEFDYPFKLSSNERAALQAILAGEPYMRIPFMNSKRNSLIAAGLAPVLWASELRMIIDCVPGAMEQLLSSHGDVLIAKENDNV